MRDLEMESINHNSEKLELWTDAIVRITTDPNRQFRRTQTAPMKWLEYFHISAGDQPSADGNWANRVENGGQHAALESIIRSKLAKLVHSNPHPTDGGMDPPQSANGSNISKTLARDETMEWANIPTAATTATATTATTRKNVGISYGGRNAISGAEEALSLVDWLRGGNASSLRLLRPIVGGASMGNTQHSPASSASSASSASLSLSLSVSPWHLLSDSSDIPLSSDLIWKRMQVRSDSMPIALARCLASRWRALQRIEPVGDSDFGRSNGVAQTTGKTFPLLQKTNKARLWW